VCMNWGRGWGWRRGERKWCKDEQSANLQVQRLVASNHQRCQIMTCVDATSTQVGPPAPLFTLEHPQALLRPQPPGSFHHPFPLVNLPPLSIRKPPLAPVRPPPPTCRLT
jgi:hypothetical protein